MERHVLIVAGGTGRRMGSAVPKQFLLLAGRPLLMHTIERMHLLCGGCGITVVLPGEFRTMWEGLCSEHRFAVPHIVVDGGEERFYSVKRGLESITGDCLVAIHDGVRPLVSAGTVRRCFEEAAKSGAAIPVVAPPESVRMVTVRGTMTVNRESIRLVQTPQVFRLDLIRKAYEVKFNQLFTDDATVAEQAGIPVSVVEGNRENIKITTPFDIIIAGAIMETENEKLNK
ncbi:MAG: 2-C-methyl-D-erythritol 4-phosphate cytidylyltransferase [Bacteroidetes bacterium]|nr:2-C-methyl-D-erythritol 4-phosphate cytidylyltransferase [Bacteroidota bacterium]